jgi:hypothetical protein
VTVLLDEEKIPVKRSKVIGLEWLREAKGVEGRSGPGRLVVDLRGGRLQADRVVWSADGLVVDGVMRLPADTFAGVDFAAGRRMSLAAVAPVAGTIAIEESKPKRPVPVIHFHGSKDTIVPFEMTKSKAPSFMKLKGVEDSIQTWVKLNGCDEKPKADTLSKDGDEMKVTRTTYGNGKDGTEVVLVVIEEGGHTWPGQQPPAGSSASRPRISRPTT